MWFGYGTDLSSLNKMWLETYDEDTDIGEDADGFVLKQTERIESTSLRGFIDSKLLNSRRSWEIVITADELGSATPYNFITAFWESGDPNYIDVTTAEGGTPDANSWINVIIPGGQIPIEFINGIRLLREFSSTFLESDGSL